MIDKLVLRAPFRELGPFDLAQLGLKRLEGSIDADGDIFDLRHPWESIPSSFSGLAFKLFKFDENRTNPAAFVELKASPAKLLQGHNVYGSDDLYDCTLILFEVFFSAYPHLYDLLDNGAWRIAQVDITYHSWADNEKLARDFINSLKNISRGQTVSRSGYDGTAYFGKKNSRIKKIKVYDKFHEISDSINSLKDNKKKLLQQSFYPDQLLNWTKGMIRWEVSLMSRWFERRDIPTLFHELKFVFDAEKYWLEATSDIMNTLKGQTMRVINDDDIYNKLRLYFVTYNIKSGKASYRLSDAAYRTYRSIKNDGYVKTKTFMSRTTFHNHCKMIIKCGVSLAYLQQMTGDNIGAEIIPMCRFANVEFRSQYPDFLKAA